jgi:hypothetical protein
VRGTGARGSLAPSPGARSHSLRVRHPLPQGEREKRLRLARVRFVASPRISRHAYSLPRAERRRALLSAFALWASADKPSLKTRGGGAPKGATTGPRRGCPRRPRQAQTSLRSLRKLESAAGASPSGAPPAAFLSPGPCFRVRDGGLLPSRSGRLSPAFVRTASSHSRQPVLVPADGYPRPPGTGVTSPGSRRRPFPASRQCPAERPSRGGGRLNISLGIKGSQELVTQKHPFEAPGTS